MNHVISFAQTCNEGADLRESLRFLFFLSGVWLLFFNRKIRRERKALPCHTGLFPAQFYMYMHSTYIHFHARIPYVWHGARHAEKKTMSCYFMCMYSHQCTYSSATYPSLVISLLRKTKKYMPPLSQQLHPVNYDRPFMSQLQSMHPFSKNTSARSSNLNYLTLSREIDVRKSGENNDREK